MWAQKRELPHVDIQFEARWTNEDNKPWGISCELSEQVSADIVLDRVRRRHTSRARTINMIKTTLNPDGDVPITNLRVSLQCPVGQIRMSTPIRSINCRHLQVIYWTGKISRFDFCWRGLDFFLKFHV